MCAKNQSWMIEMFGWLFVVFGVVNVLIGFYNKSGTLDTGYALGNIGFIVTGSFGVLIARCLRNLTKRIDEILAPREQQ